ncbi:MULTISPECIES: hypothetical protein [Methylorubrum]|uniref:hypothetical protein n=1 Tax=Methylorubrum TaxID=2282523 RepID=UPI00209F0B90|nr:MULTISPECIES: hypothetical protein [Methylorubrum]MCP1550721.1 SOS-response transcriptional repressor LexA [Methylorubrum zatmanii]MCP1552666.1 SOS-response transcriptional repressor LexA [Methylorubrum extorquens]MCP1581024.1 SOS-response transcriptional repressor LexA [Methylorubrum extorquens]
MADGNLHGIGGTTWEAEMKYAVAAIVCAAALAGCAGTQSQMRLLENQNALRIEPTSGPGYDYTVVVKNVKDVGYNPDNKADRDDIALRAIAAQCPNAAITKEEAIETGTYLLGNPSRDYFMRIRCRPT